MDMEKRMEMDYYCSCIQKLVRRENYEIWKFCMWNTLGAFQLDKNVEKDLADDADSEEVNGDRLALSQIHYTVEESIVHTHLNHVKSARQAWSNLDVMYGPSEEKQRKVLSLERELKMCEMRTHESVHDYIKIIVVIKSEMISNGYYPKEKMFVERLHVSLPQMFEHLVMMVMATKDLETTKLEDLCGLLCCQELNKQSSFPCIVETDMGSRHFEEEMSVEDEEIVEKAHCAEDEETQKEEDEKVSKIEKDNILELETVMDHVEQKKHEDFIFEEPEPEKEEGDDEVIVDFDILEKIHEEDIDIEVPDEQTPNAEVVEEEDRKKCKIVEEENLVLEEQENVIVGVGEKPQEVEIDNEIEEKLDEYILIEESESHKEDGDKEMILDYESLIENLISLEEMFEDVRINVEVCENDVMNEIVPFNFNFIFKMNDFFENSSEKVE